MGWFEEQVKTRRDLDAKSFEEAFVSLAGIKRDNQSGLSDEEIRENYAISQILSFFKYRSVDIPKNMPKFLDKLNYALGQYDIQYRKVELNDSYITDANSPLLFFSVINDIPIVLFPAQNDRYYYINYQTGKRVYIDASLINGLELEAFTFYRPLPNERVSIGEYIKYIAKTIRTWDILLFILVSVVATGVGLILPYLTRILTGDVAKGKDFNQFTLISIYVVAAASGLVLLNCLKTFVSQTIAIRVEKTMKEAALMRLLALPASFFKKYNTGELTMRFNCITELANLLVVTIFTTLVSIVMSLAYLVQLSTFSSSLILPVAMILLASIVFSVFVSIMQKENRKKLSLASSKEAGVTYEMINGIQKIRLSGSEKRFFAKWANAYAKTSDIQYHPPIILRLAPAITLLITLAGNIVLYHVALKNNVDVGAYMAFVSGYGVLSAAFAFVMEMIGGIFIVEPIFDMVRPILEAEKESGQGRLILESVKGNIKIENVSFKYPESGALIVDNLSLDIKEGEYVAIVGHTGCGKSTLVRLILGFEKPTEGKIMYDGIDINDIEPSSLRRNIGTVMQSGTLFHADILSNIIISNPSLKEEDAWIAAEIADIADDIRNMPMGMKTVISEGQGGISGGQKQRLMIARAIVHKPKVLIFDEATSALDNKTQRSITEAIGKLNCTRIFIAHRLSTIKNADRIIMLEGGKIVEQGTYTELIDKKCKFAELVDRQRLDN